MSVKIKPEYLLAIADRGAEGDTLAERGWAADDDGGWVYEGEHAAGEPTWRVYVYSGRAELEREIGVYRQRWDYAVHPANLGTYARAMDAADEALGRALMEAGR